VNGFAAKAPGNGTGRSWGVREDGARMFNGPITHRPSASVTRQATTRPFRRDDRCGPARSPGDRRLRYRKISLFTEQGGETGCPAGLAEGPSRKRRAPGRYETGRSGTLQAVSG